MEWGTLRWTERQPKQRDYRVEWDVPIPMLNEWTRESNYTLKGRGYSTNWKWGTFRRQKDRTEFPLTKGEAYGAETQPLAKELKGLIRQACEV